MSTVEGPSLPGAPDPIAVIRPRTGRTALDLGEIWAYRELLYFFVWRDVKVRYKQTAFGALWALIQPAALMVVFTLVFGRLGGIAPEGVPYPLFAFAALVPWTLFSSSLIASSNSLVNSADLLKKVYFPRLLLPVAAVISFLPDFVMTMTMLFILAFVLGAPPTIATLWLIPIAGLLLATSFGFGAWLSSVNVRYRDVRYAIPFIVQLWLFATPVAYPATLIPEELWLLYHLNPMAGVIEGFRWVLIAPGDAAPVREILVAATSATVVLTSGLLYFRRVERTFADVV